MTVILLSNDVKQSDMSRSICDTTVMDETMFQEACDALRKLKLYKSDRHFSLFWLGASHSYLAVAKREARKPSAEVLLRFADRLNSRGFYEIGCKLHAVAMRELLNQTERNHT